MYPKKIMIVCQTNRWFYNMLFLPLNYYTSLSMCCGYIHPAIAKSIRRSLAYKHEIYNLLVHVNCHLQLRDPCVSEHSLFYVVSIQTCGCSLIYI